MTAKKDFIDKTCHPVLSKIISFIRKKTDETDLNSRLARGAFWSIVGGIASRITILLTSIIVARVLGHTAYGELGIIQSTIGMFGVIAGFGLGLTATKYVSEFKIKDPCRVGRIIFTSEITAWIVGGGSVICMVLVAPYLSDRALAAPQLEKILILSSSILLLSSISGAQNGALAGFEEFKILAKINIVTGFFNLILQVGGVLLWGLPGCIAGMIIGLIFNCVLNARALSLVCSKNGIKIIHNRNSLELEILWRFSLPCLAGSLSVAPVYWICSALLVNKENGYEEMGLFNAANQWFGLVLFLPNVVSQALLPVMSAAIGRNDKIESKRALKIGILINLIVSLPIVFLGCGLSYYIMGLYGEDFRQGWDVLCLVFMTAGIVAVLSPVGQTIAANSKMWWGAAFNLGWGLIFILLCLFLIEKGAGASGMALARFLAYILHAIWVLLYARNIMRNVSS